MLTIIMPILVVASLCGVDGARAHAGDVTEAPAFNTLLDSLIREGNEKMVQDGGAATMFKITLILNFRRLRYTLTLT
jgi:hypothetical protein